MYSYDGIRRFMLNVGTRCHGGCSFNRLKSLNSHGAEQNVHYNQLSLHLKGTNFLSDFPRLSLPSWIIFLSTFSDQVMCLPCTDRHYVSPVH